MPTLYEQRLERLRLLKTKIAAYRDNTLSFKQLSCFLFDNQVILGKDISYASDGCGEEGGDTGIFTQVRARFIQDLILLRNTLLAERAYQEAEELAGLIRSAFSQLYRQINKYIPLSSSERYPTNILDLDPEASRKKYRAPINDEEDEDRREFVCHHLFESDDVFSKWERHSFTQNEIYLKACELKKMLVSNLERESALENAGKFFLNIQKIVRTVPASLAVEVIFDFVERTLIDYGKFLLENSALLFHQASFSAEAQVRQLCRFLVALIEESHKKEHQDNLKLVIQLRFLLLENLLRQDAGYVQNSLFHYQDLFEMSSIKFEAFFPGEIGRFQSILNAAAKIAPEFDIPDEHLTITKAPTYSMLKCTNSLALDRLDKAKEETETFVQNNITEEGILHSLLETFSVTLKTSLLDLLRLSAQSTFVLFEAATTYRLYQFHRWLYRHTDEDAIHHEFMLNYPELAYQACFKAFLFLNDLDKKNVLDYERFLESFSFLGSDVRLMQQFHKEKQVEISAFFERVRHLIEMILERRDVDAQKTENFIFAVVARANSDYRDNRASTWSEEIRTCRKIILPDFTQVKGNRDSLSSLSSAEGDSVDTIARPFSNLSRKKSKSSVFLCDNLLNKEPPALIIEVDDHLINKVKNDIISFVANMKDSPISNEEKTAACLDKLRQHEHWFERFQDNLFDKQEHISDEGSTLLREAYLLLTRFKSACEQSCPLRAISPTRHRRELLQGQMKYNFARKFSLVNLEDREERASLRRTKSFSDLNDQELDKSLDLSSSEQVSLDGSFIDEGNNFDVPNVSVFSGGEDGPLASQISPYFSS